MVINQVFNLKSTFRLFTILSGLIVPVLTQANPDQDRQQLTDYYRKIFPGLSLADFADGVYAIDPIARESWQAIEEFPPYETAIDNGDLAFHTPFNNGSSYADCFPERGIGIAHRYPHWDSNKKAVVTLAQALNECRIVNGETPLPYKKGAIADLLAYMVYTSRGKTISIVLPDQEPLALAAFEAGRDYYYQRRGQLNFSCASCHIQNAGKRIRAEILSPLLGHTTNWPTYRLKWNEMGTLQRRIIGCHKQIRAATLPAQSPEYNNLEYFMSYICNGLPINGPSVRK